MVKLSSALLYKQLEWVRGTLPYKGHVKEFKATWMTYGLFGVTGAIFGASMISTYIQTVPPAPVASDANKYDRKTKSYSK